jgi:hypothetical protein
MLPHELLVIGAAAGLALCALLRWTPSWPQLLTALVAASLIDLAINGQMLRRLGLGSTATALSYDLPVYPHTCPCLAVAFIGILAVIHMLQG